MTTPTTEATTSATAATAEPAPQAQTTAPTATEPSLAGGASAPASSDSTQGTPGADSLTGAAGNDSTSGDSAEGGNDSVAALTLDSYDLKFPEEFTADADLVAKFKSTALDAKLDPASAQKFTDLYVEAQKSLATQIQSQYQTVQADWLKEIAATPDFATADKKAESLAAIGRMMDEYGSPEVREALNITGAGNNPHVVSLLLKAAKALSEGAPTRAGNPAIARKAMTPGEALYGDKYKPN